MKLFSCYTIGLGTSPIARDESFDCLFFTQLEEQKSVVGSEVGYKPSEVVAGLDLLARYTGLNCDLIDSVVRLVS